MRRWRKNAGPWLSSFTISANSAITGKVSNSSTPLATTSNTRLATLDSIRPDENPSEKISQLGLSVSRSTRPVSRSMKLEKSLTWTPAVLIRSRSFKGSALRRSSSASTTSLAPRSCTWRERSAIALRGMACSSVPWPRAHGDVRRRPRKPLSGRSASLQMRRARAPAPSTSTRRRNAAVPRTPPMMIRLSISSAMAKSIA